MLRFNKEENFTDSFSKFFGSSYRTCEQMLLSLLDNVTQIDGLQDYFFEDVFLNGRKNICFSNFHCKVNNTAILW